MLGFGELVLIAIILLLVLGPSRLTSMGPALGKAIRGFRQGLNGDEEAAAAKKIPEREKDVTPPQV